MVELGWENSAEVSCREGTLCPQDTGQDIRHSFIPCFLQHLPNPQILKSPFPLLCLELQRLFLVYSNTLAPFEDLRADIN